MANKFEGTTPPQESGDKGQQVRSLIESFSGEDSGLFKKYIQLPNKPDIQPEVMQLIMQYGEKFSQVTDQVEEMRQRLGISYDDLREQILNQLKK